MSRFYASTTGQDKKELTRQGSTNSGVTGHIRGWDVGIFVQATVNDQDEDIISIYLTSGSNDKYPDQLIGYAKLEAGQPKFFVNPKKAQVEE